MSFRQTEDKYPYGWFGLCWKDNNPREDQRATWKITKYSLRKNSTNHWDEPCKAELQGTYSYLSQEMFSLALFL